ncbi:MAG: CCA tRNA nucleotidyltransferase, partial [Paracoccaceae bacterium]
MRISGDWLTHPGTQSLCAVLADAGYQALFVGGCVRNALLGEPVADVDIATDALPETVTKLAERAGFRVIPTGIDHGTVTVIASGVSHEVTTFRRDVETDGRRAVVAFSTDFAEDAARRDFTMNALYADSEGQVLDPLSGLADLMARVVRFVGDPEARIREDYLRILRFFRFHAWYGDSEHGFDADGLAACAALNGGIETLSRERIGAEMRKLLSAPNPAPAVGTMAQAGVLAFVLPGADPRGLAPLVHLEGDMPPRWLRRLAVLGGENPDENLRLSRAEKGSVQQIRDEIGSAVTPAALGWKLGADLATDTLLARAALLSPLPPNWQADIERGVAATCPVSSIDLMPQYSGPDLGQRLRDLQDRWLQSDLRATKAELL